MTPPHLPLRALHAFAETLRAGGIGRAADRLGLTHGAVSRQIATLEARLGLILFTGPRNARRPTAEAEALFAEIDAPLVRLAEAVARRSAREETLVVSCVSTLAARWLIPRLPDFARREPGIAVEIRESYAPLDRGLDGCDLAVRMREPDAATPSGLIAHPFMANAVGLVVAPGVDPEARRLVSRSHPGAWVAWRALTGLPGPTTAHQTFDHQRTMIEAALAGLGACVTQRALVEADVAAGRLVAPHDFLADTADFTLYMRRGFETRAARRFLDWLKQQGAGTTS